MNCLFIIIISLIMLLITIAYIHYKLNSPLYKFNKNKYIKELLIPMMLIPDSLFSIDEKQRFMDSIP